MPYLNKCSLIATMLLTPCISFAFFCPTNFNQIAFGMTVDQVTQICGKPTSQKEYVKPNDNIPQEWVYFIPQTVGMGGSTPQAQGTLRASISFDDKGNAINISVNGIGVGGTTICGGSNVQLGATRDQIKSACGQPSFINKQSSDTTGQPQSVKVIELNYANGNPPTILIFENGKLTDKK